MGGGHYASANEDVSDEVIYMYAHDPDKGLNTSLAGSATYLGRGNPPSLIVGYQFREVRRPASSDTGRR